MVSRRDTTSIETEIGRTFEQMIPFNRVLGLKIDSLDPKTPRLRFDMRPELVGNPVRQILHGGVISATLDVVGGLAIALASLAKKAEETPARQFPNIGHHRPARRISATWPRQIFRCLRPRRSARRSRGGGPYGARQQHRRSNRHRLGGLHCQLSRALAALRRITNPTGLASNLCDATIAARLGLRFSWLMGFYGRAGFWHSGARPIGATCAIRITGLAGWRCGGVPISSAFSCLASVYCGRQPKTGSMLFALGWA